MSNSNNINVEKLAQDISQLKVLVIGDVMLDRYCYGSVSRISPEAPVPVVLVESKEDRLGGASNVALNCKAMGAQVSIAGLIGDDEAGRSAIALLESSGINAQLLLKDPNRPTTIKTRVISRSQQLFRMDEEAVQEIDTLHEHRLIDVLLRYIQIEKPQVVIFEDYDKGTLNQNIIEKVIQHSRLMGCIIAIDPKFRNFHFYKNATIFKPNLKEVSEAFQLKYHKNPLEVIEQYSEKIQQELNPEVILITLSELGVYVHHQDQFKIIPAKSRKIADVSGAGDTVVAVAALVYAITKDPYTTAQLANIAGGMVCEYVGVVPINMEDWKMEIEKNFN